MRLRLPARSQITSASEIPWRRAASAHRIPGKLGLRKFVPARQVKRLQRAPQRGPQMLLGAKHGSQDLELLVGELHYPHAIPLR